MLGWHAGHTVLIAVAASLVVTGAATIYRALISSPFSTSVKRVTEGTILTARKTKPAEAGAVPLPVQPIVVPVFAPIQACFRSREFGLPTKPVLQPTARAPAINRTIDDRTPDLYDA